MKTLLKPGRRSVRKWTFVCFLLIIEGAWVAEAILIRPSALLAINEAPFSVFESGGFVGATPSVFYSAFIWLFYTLGASIQDSAFGVLVFSLTQLVLCGAGAAYGAYWIHRKGAPLWLALVFSAGLAALFPFAQGALQPWAAVPSTLILFILSLRLVDAVQDGCRGLRSAGSVCSILTLQALLLLLDLSLVFVVVPTLICMSLMPIREKAHLTLESSCMLLLSLAAVLILFPRIGLTEDGLILSLGAGGAESFIPGPDYSSLLAFEYVPLLTTLVILLWVIITRRPRYFLPFIPLLGLSLLIFLNPFVRPVGFWFLDYTYILCLPFLASVSLMGEYRETKAQMRKRILAKRAAILPPDRQHRGEEACKVLLEKIKTVEIDAGYIGLYAAQGSELPLDYLVLQLSTLGYRVAYPARISETEMDFFTTIGATNEALFDSFLIGEPFELAEVGNIEHLTRVEPNELKVLVVPAIAYDKNGYRLGFGGGYYDRYLKRVPSTVPLLGVCYQEQMVAEVPVDKYDLPLDDVVIAQSAILSTSFHWRHKRD